MGRPDRPLDPDAGPLADFAADLRALRLQAGSPTYRVLAQQTHYSATTLSEAAGGRRLPTLPVLLAYVRACGGDGDAWQARWQDMVAQQHTNIDATGADESGEPVPASTAAAPTATQDTTAAGTATQDATTHNEPRAAAGLRRLPRSRPRPRPRLGLAPLLLVLAIVITAALLGSRATPAPRLQTQPRETTAPQSPQPTTPTSAPSGPHASTSPGSPLASPSTTAGGNGQALVGAVGPAPSNAAAPAAHVGPAAQIITVGPSCGTMTRSGWWASLAGSDTGCGQGYYRKETGVQAKADWIFAPGIGKNCAFTIAIPDSATITSTDAEFQVYDATTHSNLLTRQYLDQAGHRGGSIVLLAGAPTATGTYDLQIYDNADSKTTEYAGTVTATCSSA